MYLKGILIMKLVGLETVEVLHVATVSSKTSKTEGSCEVVKRWTEMDATNQGKCP